MISKILSGAFLALLLTAVAARTQPLPPQSQSGQQSEQSKQSITGKVTNVETGGKAFSMEVNQGNNKRTIQFVLDKNTVVQGHVGAGTTATHQYKQYGGQFVSRTYNALECWMRRGNLSSDFQFSGLLLPFVENSAFNKCLRLLIKQDEPLPHFHGRRNHDQRS